MGATNPLEIFMWRADAAVAMARGAGSLRKAGGHTGETPMPREKRTEGVWLNADEGLKAMAAKFRGM
jgi:hypothetical protein